jgi:Putative Zn-dependent protease, contains TPR repeats
MENILPVLIAVITGSVLLILIMIVRSGKKKGGKTSNSARQRNRAVIIRECTKRLTHDPHNINSLQELADLYFEEQNWEKAFPLYDSLHELSLVHPEIDIQKDAIRQGMCALKVNKLDEAEKGLFAAHKLLPNDYDTNFYLGQYLFLRKEYDKAIACLHKAHTIRPDASEVNRPLGFSYYKSQHYKESLSYLRHVLDENPEDKETLFSLASAMEEAGFGEKALKVFVHLRPDPAFGAQSCLAAGMIHERTKLYQQAVQDYEIGLKLENVPPDMQTTLRYRLANAYISLNNIAKGLFYLRQIQSTMPNYKDVGTLVQRYQELNSNSNLQTYLMSGTSDFVALCRKFVEAYYPNAVVKIEDISVATESIEILCSVESSRWEDTELFRFYRNSGAVGELYVRDFHSKLRDIKCDRGFCVTAGTYTEEAHKYVEGRPIDLIEKTTLVSILKKIDMLS